MHPTTDSTATQLHLANNGDGTHTLVLQFADRAAYDSAKLLIPAKLEHHPLSVGDTETLRLFLPITADVTSYELRRYFHAAGVAEATYSNRVFSSMLGMAVAQTQIRDALASRFGNASDAAPASADGHDTTAAFHAQAQQAPTTGSQPSA